VSGGAARDDPPMVTTLDMPQTPCQLLPETEPTTIGTMRYEGFWASSVTLENIVEVDRIAANPINRTDPSGLQMDPSHSSGLIRWDGTINPGPAPSPPMTPPPTPANIPVYYQETRVKVIRTYIKNSILWETLHSSHAYIQVGKTGVGFYAESHLGHHAGSTDDLKTTVKAVPGYVANDDFSTFPEGREGCAAGAIYKVTSSVYIPKTFLGKPVNAASFENLVEHMLKGYLLMFSNGGSSLPYNALWKNCDDFVQHVLDNAASSIGFQIREQLTPQELTTMNLDGNPTPSFNFAIIEDKLVPYNPPPPLPAGVA
jgi:hypothetical protein